MTGGGGGIGAAIAEELGRGGWFVVTVDPLVTLDGSERLPEPEETTAGRIVAAGGSARASSASVTDGEAVRGLFGELVDEHGGLDAVVNVAGITRQTYFATGHRGGLAGGARRAPRGATSTCSTPPCRSWPRPGTAASSASPPARDGGPPTPVPTAAPSGPSPPSPGSWAGRHRPGVTVNAMSPIAATRMVAAAVERARQAGQVAGGGGGLTLGSMPGPEDLGPLGAYLVGDGFGWCSGRVLFAGGPEVAVVDEPRLLEVVRSDEVVSLARVLDAVIPARSPRPRRARPATAAATPGSGRSSTSRPPPRSTPAHVRSCAVVTDRPRLAASLTAALEARSITCHRLRGRPRLPGGRQGAERRGRKPSGRSMPSSWRPPASEPAGHLGAWLGAGARRAPRDRRAHPHRRRMGPGGRRLRRRRRPSRAAGDPHRRHHHRRSQPGPGRGAASPAWPLVPPTGGSRPSR